MILGRFFIMNLGNCCTLYIISVKYIYIYILIFITSLPVWKYLYRSPGLAKLARELCQNNGLTTATTVTHCRWDVRNYRYSTTIHMAN